MKKMILLSLLSIISISFTLVSDSKKQTDTTEQLFKAVFQKNIGKVRSILKSKKSYVEINRLNKSNLTMLDLAIENKSTKIAAELMKYGAKVTTETRALELHQMFISRASKFFIAGLFFTPFFWIGTYFALYNGTCTKNLIL